MSFVSLTTTAETYSDNRARTRAVKEVQTRWRKLYRQTSVFQGVELTKRIAGATRPHRDGTVIQFSDRSYRIKHGSYLRISDDQETGAEVAAAAI